MSVVNKYKNNYYYKSNAEYYQMMFVYYKCYISIELMFVKELMFIKQVHQKSVIFVTIYFLNYSFNFQPNVCNRCHNLLMMSMKHSDIAISNI